MRYVIRHAAALRYRLAPGRLQGNDHIAQQPRRGRVSQGRSLPETRGRLSAGPCRGGHD